MQVPLLQSTMSQIGLGEGEAMGMEVEMDCITDDVKGTRRFSELEKRNMREDDVCVGSGGVGVGVKVNTVEDDGINGISQNGPVKPAMQTHVTPPLSRVIHSPLIHLTKSHSETGVGDMGMELGNNDFETDAVLNETGIEETEESIGVGNGTSRLSELEMKNETEDIGMDSISIDVVRERRMEDNDTIGVSQSIPV